MRTAILRLIMWLTDVLYLFGAILTSPWWLTSMIATGKIKTDWLGRFGKTRPILKPTAKKDKKRILLHAVSVGEANAIRHLVTHLAERYEVIIATTTNTGHHRAQDLYGQNHRIVRYPFDFSFAVARFLKSIKPDAVGLVELEVWPNMTAQCKRRRIPVFIVNGRLSSHSAVRYRRFHPIVAPIFRRLTFIAAQDHAIADRLQSLGVANNRTHIVGTMKWDTAEPVKTVGQTPPDLKNKANQLAEELGVDQSQPIIVAGSTGPTEETLIHNAVPDTIQLIIAPRKPERFNEAAQAMPGCTRRSQNQCQTKQWHGRPARNPSNQTRRSGTGVSPVIRRFLLDTMGELRAAYALADIVIVGRTFTNLHGSDMIEPIALGKPVIVGPDVTNFQTVAETFLKGNGMLQVTAVKLPETIQNLLEDPEKRNQIAKNGLNMIKTNQGATGRHIQLIDDLFTGKSVKE